MTCIPCSHLFSFQKEKDVAVLREKEMAFRADMAEAARQLCRMAEARSQELDTKLQQCMVERDELQRKVEEAHSAAGVYSRSKPPISPIGSIHCCTIRHSIPQYAVTKRYNNTGI